MGATTYARTGLGAFGNCPSNGVFSTGIDGAGNSRDTKDVVSLSAEELDYREQLQRDNSPVNMHLGIGDAGNKTSKTRNPAPSVIEKIRAHFSSDSWHNESTEHLAAKFRQRT